MIFRSKINQKLLQYLSLSDHFSFPQLQFFRTRIKDVALLNSTSSTVTKIFHLLIPIVRWPFLLDGPGHSRKSQLLIRIKAVDSKSVSHKFPRRKPAKQEICDRDQFTRNRKMKSIPKRSHSRTRFDYRPNGLSIYYQRSTDDVEEEMMRIRVVTDGKPIDDSLRSSVSSPPESSSWTTLGSTSSVSGTSDKTKKRTKNKHRKRKMILSKKWKTCLRRKKEPEGMDKKSLRILDDLKILNFKIREKFQIPMDCGHIMSDSGTIRNSIPSISPDSSPSPSDVTRTAVERSHSMSPILTAEAFDYRGRPLKPSLAITPFPGARSVETRKKVREFLLGVGKDKEKKEEKSKKPQFAEFMKPPVPPVAHTPSDTDLTIPKTLEKEKKKEAPPIKLTRVSSDTRFPGARSPATREKVRLLLKDCVLKKRLKESVNEGPYDNAELTQSLKNIVKERDERKKKEEEEKKNKKKEEVVKVKKTESTSSSLRTIYSKNAIGCNTCTSCTRCISFCTEQHTRKEKTTEDSSKSRKAKKDKKKNKKKKKKETISKSSRSYSTSTASESIEISEKSKRKSKKKKSQFF
ncbi:hypothetical protein L5515_001927 [Caenorhabditis briggsae]|uniref:Uncharacterized protein n=1 Tax=Caenorhabditis briggsae TaxID=6238 RepID=A0AAE9E525_CAEBR|nr:hypothetical protein L5515_001927 [Caenorhabditis briggsae]